MGLLATSMLSPLLLALAFGGALAWTEYDDFFYYGGAPEAYSGFVPVFDQFALGGGPVANANAVRAIANANAVRALANANALGAGVANANAARAIANANALRSLANANAIGRSLANANALGGGVANANAARHVGPTTVEA